VTAQVQDMATQKLLTVWYDGANKAIALEIEQLKSKEDGRLALVDASADGFQPAGEVTADAVRQQLHARGADGKLVKGLAALGAAYDAIGLGSWFRFCRKPGLETGALFAESAEELKMAA
jgi:hypothetical protein